MPRNGVNQIRTFTWNGTDLASAANPENGTVSYTYDGNHHVTQRTDAKGQQTKYTYDTYGRLTETQHWDWEPAWYNPSQMVLTLHDQVDNYYDDDPFSSWGGQNTWGRLSAVAWGGTGAGYTGYGSEPQFWYEFNYNQAGRVTGKRMSVPFNDQNGNLASTLEMESDATWDNQGRMTSMSIPGDTTYTYTYDPMSNLSGMSGGTFSGSATYNWAGQRLTGPDGTRTYNSLMQLTRIQNTNLDEQYIYQAGQNNGRIVQSIDNVRGETVNYNYDLLNRLTSAEETHGYWGNAFSYDGWGNINGQTWTPGQAATPGTQAPPSGDANGNSGGTFDVENHLVTPTGSPSTYSYDPYGKRLEVCCPTDQYNNPYNQYTFYGIDGRPLATMGAQPNSDGTYYSWTIGTNLYFGGSLVKQNGQLVSVDRLGSVRSNGNGSIAYYPYGLERTSTPDNTNKFGTYFRDINWAGLGQDYADQRYYNYRTGNFWSPDPDGLESADLRNPTTWNRYLYTGGDPINFGDPTGRIESGGCPAEYSYDECVALGLIEGLPSESGGGGGGDPCGGSYLEPNPDPSCYAPVPVLLTQTGDDQDPLKCGYTGANLLKPGFGTGVSIGYRYHMPLYLNFAITSGSASTYDWTDTQQYSEVGSAVYSSSPIQVPINVSGTEQLTNYGQPNSTSPATGNAAPYASFYDAPGQTSNDPNFGKTVSADLTWTFTLNVSVNGVSCGSVNWSSTLTWPRKKKPHGKDTVPKP